MKIFKNFLAIFIGLAFVIGVAHATEEFNFWFDNVDEDDFTATQCAEIKRIWESGNWTDAFGDTYAPDACKVLGLWSQIVAPIVTDEEEIPEGYDGDVYIEYIENPFPDTDTDDVKGVAAAYLFYIGVINGYDDGEFKGGADVNRAEAAKFLLTAKFGGDIEDVSNNGKFSDVVSGEWYVRYVMRCSILGIIDGYDDGTFRPANTVNTVEFLKMMALTFNLQLNLDYNFQDVEGGQWYEPYIGIADYYNLFPERGVNLQPGKLLSRYDVAVAIFQYLSQADSL